jgi:hypothetical protein
MIGGNDEFSLIRGYQETPLAQPNQSIVFSGLAWISSAVTEIPQRWRTSSCTGRATELTSVS